LDAYIYIELLLCAPPPFINNKPLSDPWTGGELLSEGEQAGADLIIAEICLCDKFN